MTSLSCYWKQEIHTQSTTSSKPFENQRLMDQLNAHHTFKVSLEIRKLTMNSISVLSLGIPSNEDYLLGFPSSFNPSLHHLEAIHP
jgi:hypothetical protein